MGDEQFLAAFGGPAEPAAGAAAAGREEQIPPGPAAGQMLQAAFQVALRMGHNYVGTEPILLALLAGHGGTGAALAGLGITAAAVEQHIQSPFAAIRAARGR